MSHYFDVDWGRAKQKLPLRQYILNTVIISQYILFHYACKVSPRLSKHIRKQLINNLKQ